MGGLEDILLNLFFKLRMLVRNKSTDKDEYGRIVGGKRKRYSKIKEEGRFSFSC